MDAKPPTPREAHEERPPPRPPDHEGGTARTHPTAPGPTGAPPATDRDPPPAPGRSITSQPLGAEPHNSKLKGARRPRSRQDLLAQTEDGVTPDFGVPNAIHVHKTRAYATPPAVAAKAPTAGEREPVQHHHLYNTLSKRQSRDARRFIASFELYLTAEEVVTFRSGHRLSPDQVHDLVTELGTDQAREKGVRMSYEPTPDFTDEDLDRLRHATRSDDEPTVDVKFFLAQLWFYADPLWLELCADAHSHGINMAFNASAGAARRSARNMPMTAHKRRKLMEILDDDIQKGRAEGWYKEPPFKAYEIIPLGLVPKNIDEDIWRAIKNWSAGQGLSVNANSDTMHIPFGLFERAVEALHRAGKNVHFLKWDISGAYATIRIRPADRRLTVFHVPGKGYSHRNSCDFGGRVFGYRWEVCGGRLCSTLYRVAGPRITGVFNTGTRPTLAPFIPPFDVPKGGLRHDPLLKKPKGGWVDLSREIMSHPFGELRLLARDRQSAVEGALQKIPETPRFVDDSMAPCVSKEEAFALGNAVIFIHAALGIKLEPKKWSHVVTHTDFHGIEFWRAFTLAYPECKKETLKKRLLKIIRGEKHETSDLESAIGTCVFALKVYPQARGNLHHLFELLTYDRRADNGVGPAAPARHYHMTTEEARRQAQFWLRLIEIAEPVATSFVRPGAARDSAATVIGHCDWGMSSGQQGWGLALLSHNEYAMAPVPDACAIACTGAKGDPSSPALEAWAADFSLNTIGERARSRVVLLFSDNIPFILAFHKCTSPSKALAAALRALSITQARLGCLLLLRYVPTDDNLSDPLSRNKLQEFLRRIAGLEYYAPPSPIKPRLPTPHPSGWTQ